MRKVFPLSVNNKKRRTVVSRAFFFLHKFSGEAKSKEYNAFPVCVVL